MKSSVCRLTIWSWSRKQTAEECGRPYKARTLDLKQSAHANHWYKGYSRSGFFPSGTTLINLQLLIYLAIGDFVLKDFHELSAKLISGHAVDKNFPWKFWKLLILPQKTLTFRVTKRKYYNPFGDFRLHEILIFQNPSFSELAAPRPL